MSHLKPIASDYQPAYPRELTREQIQELLRPGLLKRFSQQTLATGALIVGMTTLGCQSETSAETSPNAQPADAQQTQEDPKAGPPEEVPEPDQPAEVITDTSYPKPPAKMKGTTTSTDPNLRKKVDAIVAEVLSKSKQGYWYKHSSLRLQKELKSNPPIKYPVIPISYGNSCVGIFDHATAREATTRLFAAYGIELKKDASLKGFGYEFSADGYDAKQNAGFELVMPQGAYSLTGKAFPKQTDAEHLSDKEKAALSQAVAAGTLNVLVMDAHAFPNMDGDLYTPMEYYLGSVVDYLNWLHGDQQIDPQKVLGKLPGRMQVWNDQVKEWQKKYATLPGCGFESDKDVKHWTVEKGTLSRTNQFSGNLMHRNHYGNLASSSKGAWSLKITLEAGGKAVYTVPAGETVRLKPENVAFACQAFWNNFLQSRKTEDLPLKIVLRGDDDKTWEMAGSVKFISTLVSEQKQAPFEVLRAIEFSIQDGSKAEFYLDDLGLSR